MAAVMSTKNMFVLLGCFVLIAMVAGRPQSTIDSQQVKILSLYPIELLIRFDSSPGYNGSGWQQLGTSPPLQRLQFRSEPNLTRRKNVLESTAI